MIESDYELIGNDFGDTANVPKDDDIWYRCKDCGKIIPSVPEDNIGCECSNVFIDKDCWRLVVVDMQLSRPTVESAKTAEPAVLDLSESIVGSCTFAHDYFDEIGAVQPSGNVVGPIR